MKFFFAVILFFIILILEISFTPFIMGVALPLSFWFCIAILLFMPQHQLLWFGLCAGFITALVYSGLYPFSAIIFVVLALVIYAVRIFFGNDGMIRYIAAVAVGIVWHVISDVLGGLLIRYSGSSHAVSVPLASIFFTSIRVLLIDLLFASAVVAAIVIREKISHATIEKYV